MASLQVYRYDKTLSPEFYDDEIFFLFEENSRWGWFFNGKAYPDLWDRIYYSYGDGEGDRFLNPFNFCFDALRDDMWYMVEIKIEPNR